MEDSNKEKRLIEIRKAIHEEIERFVMAMEKKITDSGFTPFEAGFLAVKSKEVWNDGTCEWDIGLDHLKTEELSEGKKPLSWINDKGTPDYSFIRTSHDALERASGTGFEVEIQIGVLKYLHEAFIDEIWPELEDPTKERFSQMNVILDNCIEKLTEQSDEIQQLPSILYRNHQRIALGMDKKEAA